MIFICPAVMDFTIFLVLFAVSYRVGELGMSLLQCAWLTGFFMLVYMVTSLAAGLALNRRNAKALVFGSAGVLGLLAILALFMTRFWPMFAAMALLGVASAVFFNAFQTFMRGESPPGGLAKATGMYTLSWSTGSGLGFLSAGALYRLGAAWMSGLILVVTGVIVGMLLRHVPQPNDTPSADEHSDAADVAATAQHERYVWVAWLMIFTATFVQRPILSFFPTLAAKAGVAPAMASLPLFLHMLVQGLSATGMSRLRGLSYRRLWLVVVQGLAGLLLLGLRCYPAFTVSVLGIALLGVWAGYAYLWAVFYAGNSGQRSRNVGVNESRVGLASFTTLLVTERIMKWSDSQAVMYAVCGAALLLSTAAQYVVAGPDRRATPATQRDSDIPPTWKENRQ
jgi:MFS family permease